MPAWIPTPPRRAGSTRAISTLVINCAWSIASYDVFGDGSVVCLPTHGHTPGHQSLRLRLDSGEIVPAADACYFCQTLRERRLPRYMHDREAMLVSLDRLEGLERSGAR